MTLDLRRTSYLSRERPIDIAQDVSEVANITIASV